MPPIRLAMLLLPWTALVGCGRASHSDGEESKPWQLTQNDFPCVEYRPEQVTAFLAGMPEGFVNKASWRVGDVNRALIKLAGIPQPYLDWLYQLNRSNGFDISQQALGGSTVGATYLTPGRPIRIVIDNTANAADFALQHEVGHAIEERLKTTVASYTQNIRTAFSQEARSPKLRSYARTSSAEYFAESFNNFYCSKDAHAFVKAELPNTYQLLRNVLAPPRWETNIDPASLVQDLWLKLAEPEGTAKDTAAVEISAPETMSNVALCKGDLATCVLAARQDLKFGPSDRQIAGRRVFKGVTTLTIKAGDSVTMLGYDPSGQLVGARSVRFEEAE